MLPVCSATPCCSFHPQISFHLGLKPISPFWNSIYQCIVEDQVALGLRSGFHPRDVSFKAHATKSCYSHVIASHDQSGFLEFTRIIPHQNESGAIAHGDSNIWSYSMEILNGPYPIRGNLKYVENSNISAPKDELMGLVDKLKETTDVLSGPPETVSNTDSTVDVVSKNLASVSDSLDAANDMFLSPETDIQDFLSGANESIGAAIDKGERAVKGSLDAVTSSLEYAVKNASKAIENVINNFFSAVDQTGELAGNGLTGLSSDLKESTSKAGFVAINILRHTIISAENYIARGANFVVYSYGSAKELLPPDVRGGIDLFEEEVIKILRPVGAAFKVVYIAIKGFERNLGLDPNDPVVPFFLFVGTSATLGIFYWVLTYGGYSGDLSPGLAFELLTGEENVVLIDVRPEDLRERDGIPDIRRAARFRYASVTLPEIDGSLRELLKSGRNLDDALIAAVIQNLKIVQDRSKVIVMDADGTRSKGIARSLRKLGVKRSYLVQGGFQSWVKSGLRIKELKPETTLTILNEEAEAILEDIKPTPVKIIGYGVGFMAVVFALVEWENTLQLIGIVGLGQTIYRRVASYENSEDFRQDVRLLLAPVRLGAQAISWAAQRLEPNRVGLPTSPSTSAAVRDRVLQAAAKHESQPSDTEEVQDGSPESTTITENVDLSEA